MLSNLLLFLITFILLGYIETTKVIHPVVDTPWHAQLIIGKCLRTKCGGAIISCNYILTAAHCVSFLLEPVHPSLVEVYLSKDAFSNKTINYKVTNIYLNPGLQRGKGLENDLAILKIAPKIIYTHDVRNIIIPKKPILKYTKAVLSGYETPKEVVCNMTLLLTGKLPMKNLPIKIGPCKKVSETYAVTDTNHPLSCIEKLNPANFCLKESGDPVGVKVGNKYFIEGITVKGNCNNLPHAILRIYPHHEWILKTIRHH